MAVILITIIGSNDYDHDGNRDTMIHRNNYDQYICSVGLNQDNHWYVNCQSGEFYQFFESPQLCRQWLFFKCLESTASSGMAEGLKILVGEY